MDKKYEALHILKRLPVLPLYVEQGKYHYSPDEVLHALKVRKSRSENTKNIVKNLIKRFEDECNKS